MMRHHTVNKQYMPSTEIRIAELQDIDSIEQVEKICFKPSRHSSRESLKRSLESKHQIVVVAESTKSHSNRVIGAMILYVYKSSMRIFSIGVLPEYQKAGIGCKLLSYSRKVAVDRDLASITLEADLQNTAILNWYLKNGYRKTNKKLLDYYGEGEHAVRLEQIINNFDMGKEKSLEKYRTQNIVVVDKLTDWQLTIPAAKIVLASDYLVNKNYQKNKFFRVFNLCSSFKYQTNGYYVSLIAAARAHYIVPSVTTIIDTRHQTIVQSISDDIDGMIQGHLSDIHGKEFALYIYFGQTIDKRFEKLSSNLYKLFEAPLLKVQFVYAKKWVARQITPIPLKDVPPEDVSCIPDFADRYFQRKRFQAKKHKQYLYDIAILYNPDEKTPPSCQKALMKFKKIGDRLNCYIEFITREDYSRISEFDALFIRETTSVRNHTYRFARKAFAEGLVVIDDPWSILRCSNKIYLHELLMQNKISTPRSWVITKDYLKNPKLCNLPDFPLVIKQPDGSFSIGCVKANDKSEFKEKIAELLKKSDLLIAQEFLPSDFDWRIGIMNNKPLFVCKYYMAKNHWQICNWRAKNSRYNYGRDEAVPLENVPAVVLDTALRAVRLIDNGLYGVDLKQIGDKVYVIEINDNPNIDEGVEDAILKDELYRRILVSFIERIDCAKNTIETSFYKNLHNDIKTHIRSRAGNAHAPYIPQLQPLLLSKESEHSNCCADENAP